MRQADTAIAAWRDPEMQRRKERLTDLVQRTLITAGRGMTLCEIAQRVHRQSSSVTSTLAKLKDAGGAHIVHGAERRCHCERGCTITKQVWRSGPAPSNQIPLFGGGA